MPYAIFEDGSGKYFYREIDTITVDPHVYPQPWVKVVRKFRDKNRDP
jgi:hypothetical protein